MTLKGCHSEEEEEDFYINTSKMESNNYSNVTSDYDYNYTDNGDSSSSYYSDYSGDGLEEFFLDAMKCVIISFGLPLSLLAIYSLYSQVQNTNVAPIFLINLLISDIIQLCCMIVKMAERVNFDIRIPFIHIYEIGVLASVGFMVCIALERYLVIAWPLWYHVRSTIKISLAVCVVVWTLPLVSVLSVYFMVNFEISDIIFAVLLLIPFPLLIFFLGGTLKALSAAISVSSDEKRRIVGMLVLVVLIYTLLFLPRIIVLLSYKAQSNHDFRKLTEMLLEFSPLADLILYVFIKETMDKLLASLCCCIMDNDDNNRSST
ncbi:ovarian cancer G-protein coupled receptor 1-like [Thunnus thynnus]|uniref:ovarian cancer G-protein coupled receptor 1-like n=1 Tax=Thunnus thynnus TaxID=8237 RepID=UPI00352854B4